MQADGRFDLSGWVRHYLGSMVGAAFILEVSGLNTLFGFGVIMSSSGEASCKSGESN